MSASFWIAIWWVAFGGTHTLLTTGAVRPRLIERLGDKGYQGVYSLISLATFVALCWMYFNNRHGGAMLWHLDDSSALHTLLMLVAGFAITMVAGAGPQPSPVGMMAGDKPKAYGMLRISRHPMFMSLGLWGLAHALVNGYLNDVLFFGGFFVYAILGCSHQDARKRAAAGKDLEEFFAETSLVPFAAIVTGRNKLVLGELPWVVLIVGVIVATGIYHMHPMLFG